MQNEKSLNIGYISPGWPLSSHPNGIVAYVKNITDGLAHEDIKAMILSFGIDGAEEGSSTVDISKYDNYKNTSQELLGRLFSKFNFSNAESNKYKHFLRGCEHIYENTLQHLHEPLDILEMEESFGAIYYAINNSKTRFVTRLHGPWFTMKDIFNLDNNEQFKLRVFYEGEAIKKSHGVTAPSLDVLEKVKEYYNIELPYAKVIPNPAPLVTKDAQWKLVEEPSYILFVGRFDAHKGGDLMIEAFNIIAQSNNEVALYFVGPDRGLVVDGRKLSIDEYIAKTIKDDAIRKRIKFHGHCGMEEVLHLRQKARVTVCCSRYETFSISLLEAMASGCPTVATEVGGPKEIVVDNFNGLFAEPESAESIAEKVLILLSDENKSERLSRNAIEDSAKRFSNRTVAKQSVEYYHSVLRRY